MIANALTKLSENLEAQAWWQEVLSSEHFPLIIEAARVRMRQSPPKAGDSGFTAMELLAFAQIGALAADATLNELDQLGSRAFSATRFAEEQARRGQDAMSPAKAGTGPGRIAVRGSTQAPPPSNEPKMPPPPLVQQPTEE